MPEPRRTTPHHTSRYTISAWLEIGLTRAKSDAKFFYMVDKKVWLGIGWVKLVTIKKHPLYHIIFANHNMQCRQNLSVKTRVLELLPALPGLGQFLICKKITG